METKPGQKRAVKWSVAISAVLHTVIILALVLFAAREGMLGERLKKITVTMVPKEKPPEPPREKPPEPKPVETAKSEPVKVETPKVNLPPEKEAARTTTPEPAARPDAAPAVAPSVAPPPAEIASFDFGEGRPVESSSDPTVLYKLFVEYLLRSRWKRPEGVVDDSYVAEVELAVGPEGQVLGSTWEKGSGNAAWDDSVRRALAETPSIGRPPPSGFPQKVRVRFDVEAAAQTPLE